MLPGTVTVRFFASYAEQLGRSDVELTVGEGATVADVLGKVAQLEGAEAIPHRPLVAVNRKYANAATPVTSGDEVVLIPPVAGG